MTAPEESDGAAGRVDELRRRLYRPESTDEDLRRYVESRIAQAPSPAADIDPPAPPRRTPRRWELAAAAGLVLAVAGGIGFALAPHADAPGPLPTATVQSFAVEVPSATPVPVSIDDEDAAVESTAQQYHGRGDARIPLDVSSASFQGGRVVLSVSSGDTTPISWRAVRVETARTSIEETVAGSDAPRNGVLAVEEFRYEAAPPGVMDISAAPDVRWTLLIAFPDRRPEPG